MPRGGAPEAMLPLLLFSPVLIYVMISDLRRMRIPNMTAFAGLALFAVCVPLLGMGEATARAAVAALVFAVGFALFALRVLAGGDVKFLATLMLFVPSASLSLFGLIFSAAMLLSTLAVLTLRASPVATNSRWVGLRAHGHMPMGVAMGLAGLVHLGVLANLSA